MTGVTKKTPPALLSISFESLQRQRRRLKPHNFNCLLSGCLIQYSTSDGSSGTWAICKTLQLLIIVDALILSNFSCAGILSSALCRYATMVQVFSQHSQSNWAQALADVSLAPRPPEDHARLPCCHRSEFYADFFGTDLHYKLSDLQETGVLPNTFLSGPNGPKVFRVDDECSRSQAWSPPTVSRLRGKFSVSFIREPSPSIYHTLRVKLPTEP